MNEANATASADVGSGSSRRTFLAAGTALVAGALVLRGELGFANGGLGDMATSAGPQIGVGYLLGSVGASSLADAMARGSGRIVPARTLAPGGLRNHPATMLVHGLTPGTTPDANCAFSKILFDAHIVSPDRHSTEATLPFYAWTFRRSPAPSASGRSRFVISGSRGLRVGFSIVSSDSTAATTVFTSGTEHGLPKLQPGFYLLGLEPDAWSSATTLPGIDDPSWSTNASMIVSVAAV